MKVALMQPVLMIALLVVDLMMLELAEVGLVMMDLSELKLMHREQDVAVPDFAARLAPDQVKQHQAIQDRETQVQAAVYPEVATAAEHPALSYPLIERFERFERLRGRLCLPFDQMRLPLIGTARHQPAHQPAQHSAYHQALPGTFDVHYAPVSCSHRGQVPPLTSPDP